MALHKYRYKDKKAIDFCFVLYNYLILIFNVIFVY